MNREIVADLIIIGGGTGGCAAALAAAKMGKTIVMTEETDWIGGQFTSQAVPPDEHRWIEQFGCTRSYRLYREGIRSYYRRNFPLTHAARTNTKLNPGNGIVSHLCTDPRVALAVLYEMLAPYLHNGQLTILYRHKALKAISDKDKIVSITVQNIDIEDSCVLTAPYFLDATDCGDVLPLAGVEYVTGAESIKQTGEPHAVNGEPRPFDIQGITYCFAIDYYEGENHTIQKPKDYDFWAAYRADFWPGNQLSFTAPKASNARFIDYSLFPRDGYFSLWDYRRITDKTNFVDGVFLSDITIVNWPQNDYWLGPIYDVEDKVREKHLNQAKQLSLSLLYWLQTEAPRPDGNVGYPGLRLRTDVVGTNDGLAKYPYIRESRRIKAEFTVLEQHVSADIRGADGAQRFYDTVGIGSYRIDLHPTTGNRNFIDISSWPFQIPLGSLIPVRVDNLIPACKNIGVTHITNGCFRLHPVEWNVGETAGYLAAYCLEKHLKPREVRNKQSILEEFQKLLVREGVELNWPTIQSV